MNNTPSERLMKLPEGISFEKALDTEWLETNNAGAFCSSTAADCPSRKYHGLLVTPLKGREGRWHIFSAVDASVKQTSELTLGTNKYPDTVYPDGFKYAREIRMLPFPAWIYEKDKITIKKEIFMVKGEKAVYAVFTLISGAGQIDLDLKFLFTCRNSHDLTRSNTNLNGTLRVDDNSLKITTYENIPEIEIAFSGMWKQDGGVYWDYNVEYGIEKERGLDFIEDRFVPGSITARLEKDTPFIIRVSVESALASDSASLLKTYEDELILRNKKNSNIKSEYDLLSCNAAHFFLKNPSGKRSINAGFPWFGEWGRDTMIALPGLTFLNGDKDWGVNVLLDYISMIKDGLLPNTLGETQGFTSYNSIDAGLLFCRAVIYLMQSGYGKNKNENEVLTVKIGKAVDDIVNAFLENRVPHAELTGSGLIYSGSRETQLTWMDATAWSRPVTPRWGFAVEINALWYDALNLHLRLGEMGGTESTDRIKVLAEGFPQVFQKTFWLDEQGYLADTASEAGIDRKIRPNMLFATSAAPGLLTTEQIKAVVETAAEHLLTPFGLRTLSPLDPDFKPLYKGNPDVRDSIYHQGTVWPWLIGIMVESSLRAAENPSAESDKWLDYLDNLLNSHLLKKGYGFISEIFDGLKPEHGKGTYAQAWSTGEILRAYYLIKETKQ